MEGSVVASAGSVVHVDVQMHACSRVHTEALEVLEALMPSPDLLLEIYFQVISQARIKCHLYTMGVVSFKLNMHNISNMSIAFIEQTMPTFMHNMPSCKHSISSQYAIVDEPTRGSPSIMHVQYVIIHAQHVPYQHVFAVCQRLGTTY